MARYTILLSILLFSLPILILGNPLEVRAECNADDCLRQLRGKTSLAIPFCSSYYTKTTTTTITTVVPTLNPSFPFGNNKRDLVIPTITGIPHDLLKRTISTLPTFVSKCTPVPSKLSSACSCLLGSDAPVAATTVTTTSTLPLPPQCSTSGGLFPTPLSFNSLPNGQGSSGLGFEVPPGGCCAYCYASPNCIAFYEIVDYTPLTAGNVACSIEILGDVPVEPFVALPTCPLGLVTLTQGPPETSVLYGEGPCATVVASTV